MIKPSIMADKNSQCDNCVKKLHQNHLELNQIEEIKYKINFEYKINLIKPVCNDD